MKRMIPCSLHVSSGLFLFEYIKGFQTLTLSPLARGPLKVQTHADRVYQLGSTLKTSSG